MVDQRGFNKSFRKKEKLCWGECDAPSTVDIGALALFFKATRLKDLWHWNLWPLTKIFDTKNPNARYSACWEVWGAPWGRIEKIANVVISWCLLSLFEFLNLSWTVNTLTKSLNQYIIVIVLVVVIVINLGWQLDGLDATYKTTTYVTKARGKMLVWCVDVWCVGVWCVGVWCVGVCGVVQ